MRPPLTSKMSRVWSNLPSTNFMISMHNKISAGSNSTLHNSKNCIGSFRDEVQISLKGGLNEVIFGFKVYEGGCFRYAISIRYRFG